MIDYRNIIKNRELRLKIIQKLSFIPDSLYLKLVFFIKTGKSLNLEQPKTFCDKQNWLKIHKIHPEYSMLVDKLNVSKIVNNKLNGDYFFPLLGVWSHYEEIDFSILPQKFVLKCNHDSGSVKVVLDKDKIDHRKFKEFFNGRLCMDTYSIGREYPYRGIIPKIFAEKYMVPSGETDIKDYKFFCFDGKPEIMFVATDRNIDCKFDFFDMDFKHLDITNIHPQSGKKIEKPVCFEAMKQIAAKLSKGIPFVRIDLYQIQNRIYFGEYTFFHGGGFWPMFPEKWENKLGNLLLLDDYDTYSVN